MKDNDFTKMIKINKKHLIMGIIFSILFIVSLVIINDNLNSQKFVHLFKEKKENYAVYIIINSYPVSLQENCEEENCGKELASYYIVTDIDNYIDVLNLSEEKYNEIMAIENIEDNPILIKGTSKKMTSKIATSAIKAYNKKAEKEVINKENQNKYIGEYTLETINIPEEVKYEHNYPTYILVGLSFLMFLAGFGTIFMLLKNKSKSKEVIESLDEQKEKNILKELEKESAIKYEKARLYLTDTYIIDANPVLKIIKYSDIVWFYKKETKDYGIFLSKRSVIAFDKSKNNYEIASGIKVRNKKDFENVYNIVKEKCKKAMEGYSEENVEKYIKILKK